MNPFTEYLPGQIVELLRTRMTAEFATVTKSGLPIDTPTYFFPSDELTTLDIGTGLAYPAKAERARRNPKVGMLVEGSADDPVVSIAGYAAVRDADLQQNLERYVAETILAPNINPDVIPWEQTRSTKTYYLPRIIVCVAPCHIRWWPNRAAMEGPPAEWRAPAGTVFPKSDPAPSGKPTPATKWPQKTWRELADRVYGQDIPGHLTLLDDEGFPLPIRVKSFAPHPDGFRITVPVQAPWTDGSATLSFFGREVFVGEVTRDGDTAILAVERAMPILPMVEDPSAGPGKQAFADLMKRLENEAARRNQNVPVIPEVPPQPTEGAKLRAAAAEGSDLTQVGSGISRD